MVNRIEIIPLEVRGYGNIVTPKTSNDFIGKYNEIYTNIDGDFVLSYGGVMLKITSNVSNTIKGLTAGLNVIVTTRDGGVPVSGLTVDCSIDEVSLTSETTDSNGECSFNWTPQIVGDSVILLTITAQDDYAGLTETKEITIGLLLSFNSIMNDLRLEDDKVYIADISEQVESRTQLNPFVKDVWVAEGGEPIVDEYGIIHLAKKGDVIVEQDSLDQSLEYDNVIFEGDVELLTGAVYDMSLTEDYELIVNCLERDDIIGASGLISLTASQTSVTYGSSVTLTATVIDGDTPVSGGTVTFYDGETSLGTDTTDSDGVATLSTSSLSVGSHSLSAVYDESTSNVVSVTVNKLTPTITLSVPSAGTVGTSYNVTGTLSVDGSVKLYENSVLKDTLTVSSGSFSKAVTQNSEGTYSYYAVFEGSSTYESVTSSTGSIVVSDVPTPSFDGISLTGDKSILSYADSDTCTLTVQLLDDGSPASVSGESVDLFVNGDYEATVITNSNGVASYNYVSTGVGDVSLTASVDSYTSTAVTIEDCLHYIDGSDPSPLANQMTSYSLKPMTSVTPTLTSDGTKITITPSSSSTNVWQRGNLSFLNGLNNFKISAIMLGKIGFELTKDNYLYVFTNESRWIVTRTNTDTWTPSSLVTLDSSLEYYVEMGVNGSNVALKITSLDGTVLVNTSKTMTAQMSDFGLVWTKTDSHTIRELKVKPL